MHNTNQSIGSVPALPPAPARAGLTPVRLALLITARHQQVPLPDPVKPGTPPDPEWQFLNRFAACWLRGDCKACVADLVEHLVLALGIYRDRQLPLLNSHST